MKILHVAETIKGGIAVVLRQLLLHDEDNFTVICLVPDAHVTELYDIDPRQVSSFKRTGRNLFSLLHLLCAFVKIILREKPDIIHLHSSFAGFVCRLVIPLFFLTYRPRVVYCPHAFSFIMKGSRLRNHFFAIIERFLSCFTDKIICTSHYEKKVALKYGMADKKISVVYNGVMKPVGKMLPVDTPFILDKINILYVGRFDYQKGFDILLGLNDCLDKDRFMITAVGDFVNNVPYDISNNQINFTGWLPQEKLRSYFHHADVLVMPSRWESFGLVAVEAQSYGLPVIASNCASLPEVIINNKTGYLFESENVNELFAVVSRYSRTHWLQMRGDCRNHYFDKFTSEKMCRNVKHIYEGLLK
ncbi:glycosyltransferase [Pantoea ananatis]|uniref:glycosyltransferase n=1 Tax=Pantoea ananas TaxID=553 RepID=UPI001B301028|nr:glycosyltransferase [Pantoea ananatis]